MNMNIRQGLYLKAQFGFRTQIVTTYKSQHNTGYDFKTRIDKDWQDIVLTVDCHEGLFL